MTTIASPRPSLTLSSRRTSTSTDTITRSESSSRQPGPARRNRAALREFYGIKTEAKTESVASGDTLPLEESSPVSVLDNPDFDADKYVEDVLRREGLEGILKVEASLLRDIRGFDGEKKALVYDNYSKLIGATDTIRKMRGNMDPLKPTFTTLTPAISHIATTAKSISDTTDSTSTRVAEESQRERQQRLVQYVLATPTRLRELLASGNTEAATEDWTKTDRILEQWKNVPGASTVREECVGIMQSKDSKV
ncbi:Vacuolar protein sorting-associated protein 51 [Sphaceloma murrayae]|uniref:Vacuolar protein sorting-associated protein 51 homolog n=1 Tax=Sphaceloma murrayae TaxID=2082308 RepID=A0A2K1R230_9PEZI|nr:Vacuolar protein sorting-associated protein 51 [Sphaceloma murrayae]